MALFTFLTSLVNDESWIIHLENTSMDSYRRARPQAETGLALEASRGIP